MKSRTSSNLPTLDLDITAAGFVLQRHLHNEIALPESSAEFGVQQGRRSQRKRNPVEQNRDSHNDELLAFAARAVSLLSLQIADQRGNAENSHCCNDSRHPKSRDYDFFHPYLLTG